MRLFVAIAFAAALLVPGTAGAHFAKSLQADSPLQLVQDKDKDKGKKKQTKKKAAKATEPAPSAPAGRDLTPKY